MLTGQKTGDTALDNAVAKKTLEKDWDSFGATIYTDGAATHGSGPPYDPRIHQQCSLPADKCRNVFCDQRIDLNVSITIAI